MSDRRRELWGSALLASLLFLFGFRAHWAFMVNAQNDDGCYLAILGQILGQSTQGVCVRVNYFAPGGPILWIPAGIVGLVGKWVEGFTGGTRGFYEWAIPAIALLSYLFFAAAIWACTQLLAEADPDKRLLPGFRPLWALAIVLNAPVLYYALHWAVMPHTAQLLLAFLNAWLLYRDRYASAALAAGLLALVRYNDAPALLLLFGRFADRNPGFWKRIDWRKLPPIAWLSACLALTVAAWVGWVAFIGGYGGSRLIEMLETLDLEGAQQFLYDSRSGMAWTGLWWLLAIVLGLVRFARLSWMARAAMIWIVTELLICVAWKGTGGDFGYRYLIGCYAGATLVWLELARDMAPRFLSAFRALTAAGAIWLTWVTFAYRTTPELSPGIVRNEYDALVGTGVPDLFWLVIARVFDPEVYRLAALQQLPFVTLAISWLKPLDPAIRKMAVPVPGQILLSVAVLAALATIAGYFWVFRRRES